MPIPTRRWRSPAVLRAKSLVVAALGVTVAAVFFPVWFAVPVAVLLGGWELSLAVLGGSVLVDGEATLLVLRTGLITRRIRLADVTAVLVEASKVSIARGDGGEISVYAWRKSTLDGWLRVPAVAGDIGHAVASAVALARDDTGRGNTARDDTGRDDTGRGNTARDNAGRDNAGRHDTGRDDTGALKQEVRTGTSARTRSALATALLGCTGLLALAAAFLVRVHWHNPVLTTLGVILALALGISGLFYVLFALWLITTRAPRSTGKRPSAA